jgi:hypothetical protein
LLPSSKSQIHPMRLHPQIPPPHLMSSRRRPHVTLGNKGSCSILLAVGRIRVRRRRPVHPVADLWVAGRAADALEAAGEVSRWMQ